MAAFRVLLGIGIGGDYPMSASVVADRAHLKKRGTVSYTLTLWPVCIRPLVLILSLSLSHSHSPVLGRNLLCSRFR